MMLSLCCISDFSNQSCLTVGLYFDQVRVINQCFSGSSADTPGRQEGLRAELQLILAQRVYRLRYIRCSSFTKFLQRDELSAEVFSSQKQTVLVLKTGENTK